jgi:curved DNA-binding protein CbpA
MGRRPAPVSFRAMAVSDFYDTLGVERSATEAEIK